MLRGIKPVLLGVAVGLLGAGDLGFILPAIGVFGAVFLSYIFLAAFIASGERLVLSVRI